MRDVERASRWPHSRAKRVLDLSLTLLMAVALLPLFIGISLFILITDGMPVFFRQARIGQMNKTFTVFKFRTMPSNTPSMSSVEARNLPVTKSGAWLRRLSLDELPQLLNVARGDMSLVGPRPSLKSQTILNDIRNTNGASLLRPGLTGLAQIEGFDGMDEQAKAEIDGWYADHASFALDVKILFQTFAFVFRGPPVV